MNRATLNYAESAEYLGISKRTIEKLVSENRLPVVWLSARRRAIRIAALDAYMKKREVSAV